MEGEGEGKGMKKLLSIIKKLCERLKVNINDEKRL